MLRIHKLIEKCLEFIHSLPLRVINQQCFETKPMKKTFQRIQSLIDAKFKLKQKI
ncbi:hypothetical protein [Campylobacter troglodytis]|uniref:hypothetical protein n=1 Tax=Campylobacter troglodytis TaxID=654363 RepID=UPI00163BE6F1|nr:hypothetical protein [Campylobacter troglodytis]